MISDQGREFVNKVNQSLFQRFKTEHRISTAYHPQTNGLVECYNQTLQQCLIKLVNREQDNWDEYIDGVLFAYRTSKQKSTQCTPFELMYCRYYTNMIILSRHYICYYRKPILPIEKELIFNEDMDSMSDGNEIDDIDEYTEKMVKLKKSLFSKANPKIKDSQAQQKRYYDKKHHQKKVSSLAVQE